MFTSSACDNSVSLALDLSSKCSCSFAAAGTYGGHLELSAFAHMTKRNVKVVQPGLVYVIQWDAGGDSAPDRSPSPAPSASSSAPHAAGADDDEKPLTRRERRRLERQTSAAVLPPPPDPIQGATQPTIYVACVCMSRPPRAPPLTSCPQVP